MRISALWCRLTDYTWNTFRELSRTPECTLQLVYYAPGGNLHFNAFDVSYAAEAICLRGAAPADLQDRVERFEPDILFMPGWNFPHYMAIARRLRRGKTRVVVGLDNPWLGTLRQRIGCLVAPILLKPAIDTFFVAGERQRQFARRLGYENSFEGLCCANLARLEGVRPFAERPAGFLYVGSLIEVKGARLLINAYRRYRRTVADPLPLVVAGKGALEGLFAGCDGVELKGFVQPSELADLYSAAQCLVLPSLNDHWGVVLQEASAAGLALIASNACGASDRFLRDRANGFLVAPDEDSVLEGLVAFHGTDARQRAQMSAVSEALGRSWTPRQQVATFLRASQALRDSSTP